MQNAKKSGDGAAPSSVAALTVPSAATTAKAKPDPHKKRKEPEAKPKPKPKRKPKPESESESESEREPKPKRKKGGEPPARVRAIILSLRLLSPLSCKTNLVSQSNQSCPMRK